MISTTGPECVFMRLIRDFRNKYHRPPLGRTNPCEQYNRKTTTTRPECAVMCYFINTHAYTDIKYYYII